MEILITLAAVPLLLALLPWMLAMAWLMVDLFTAFAVLATPFAVFDALPDDFPGLVRFVGAGLGWWVAARLKSLLQETVGRRVNRVLAKCGIYPVDDPFFGSSPIDINGVPWHMDPTNPQNPEYDFYVGGDD